MDGTVADKVASATMHYDVQRIPIPFALAISVLDREPIFSTSPKCNSAASLHA